MRRLSIMILLVSILLTGACSQSPIGEVTPENEAKPLPTNTAADSQAPQSMSGLLKKTPSIEPQAGPQTSGKMPSPKISWRQDAQTKLVSATFCCGYVPKLFQLNYIPSVQIWGDGRIVWTETNNQGGRRVLEGKLSMDQVSTLLQNAADQGFFSWKEFYTDPLSPTDLPTQCLTINLESQSRTVCEYYKGAPEAFHELYDLLAAGAGTAGQDFIPQKGYLVVYPLKGDNQAIEQDKTPVWDSAEMGVSLANSVNGAWIEGATLKAAWEIINKDMYVFIRENEALYQISLQIPGISMNEPPAP